MDTQRIIVAVILFLATVYIGRMLIGRAKSFAPQRKNCGGDCGCDTKSRQKISPRDK